MRGSVCILDVGSQSVGIALAVEERGKPTVVKNARVAISSGTEEAKAGIQNLAVEAAGKAFDALKGAKAPGEIHIVLAAPWYNAKVRTISSKSEKPVRVMKSTVARAVKEYFAQKGEPHTGYIESLVSQVYVNGYSTSLEKPVVGTALKINHYVAEADHAIQEGMKTAALKAYPHAQIHFHSFAFVAFDVLRAVRSENNFLIADIGGEITDVSIAHHDGLRFIGTFPAGTLSITREIAGKGSLADARSRLALSAKGELSSEESAAFAEIFSKASASWNAGYQSLIEAAFKDVGVPQTVFLFGDKDELPWLTTLVSGAHGSVTSRAIPVTPDFFQQQVALGEGASYDAFLAMSTLYVLSASRTVLEA